MLLRPGGLPVEAIAEALGRPVGAPRRAPASPPRASSPRTTPPRRALRLDAAGPGARRGLARLRPGRARPGLNLSPSGDLAEAAANLFAHLREADALAGRAGAAGIAVAPIPRTGLGLAHQRPARPRRRPAVLGAPALGRQEPRVDRDRAQRRLPFVVVAGAEDQAPRPPARSASRSPGSRPRAGPVPSRHSRAPAAPGSAPRLSPCPAGCRPSRSSRSRG